MDFLKPETRRDAKKTDHWQNMKMPATGEGRPEPNDKPCSLHAQTEASPRPDLAISPFAVDEDFGSLWLKNRIAARKRLTIESNYPDTNGQAQSEAFPLQTFLL